LELQLLAACTEEGLVASIITVLAEYFCSLAAASCRSSV